ncbi:MAG: thiamine-phosphate kinase [Sulfurovum sp.]
MKILDKEEYLINRLSSKYIGDDGAILGDYIYSMDAFFEDVHFKREWMTLAQIGRKAMLVNISDAIAMNAQPKYALLSISLPYDLTTTDIDMIMDSIEDTAGEFGCELIGGDTVGADKLHISITIISKSSSPLMRKGLKVGDLLAYTGALGESRKDLNRLFDGEKIANNSKFFEPILRADFISKSREFLSTGMDISDGLFCDTNKMLDYNTLGFTPLVEIDDEIGLSGEEYEMLIGFPIENIDAVQRVAKETNTPLCVFARVIDNSNRLKCKSHHFKN